METDGTGRASPWAPKRLLIVDDDDDFREVLSDILRAGGHAVVAADSGAAALGLLGGPLAVDLLITDLSMPGMDGVSLIQRVQQQRRQLPAILLTGLADEGVAATLQNVLVGRYAVLRKPVEARSLLERIAEMLALEGSASGQH